MSADAALLFVPVGDNAGARRSAWTRASARAGSRPTPGSSAPTRLANRPRGTARKHGLRLGPGLAQGDAGRPRTVLTLGGKPVMAHVPAGEDAASGDRGAREPAAAVAGYEALAAETAELSYAELRKRERPFVLPLDASRSRAGRARAYDAAYKGVTDVADALSVAQAGLLPDALGGAGVASRRTSSRWSARSSASSPSSCSGAANIGGACCRASSSWCSTRSTGSSRG